MRKIFLSIFLLFLAVLSGQAQSARLNELKNKRKEVLENVEETMKLLNRNKKSTRNTLYKLNVLSDQIKKREKFISTIDKELLSINSEIKVNNRKYKELEYELSECKRLYALSVSRMSKKVCVEDKLLFLLSADDLMQMARRARYLKLYSNSERVKSDEIKDKQKEVNDNLERLRRSYKDRANVLTEKKKEKNFLQQEKTRKNSLVKRLSRKRRTLNSEMKKQKILADKLNRQIESIIAEEARKARLAAAGKDSSEIMIDERISSDFSKNKGILPWPVSKRGAIIVHFGARNYSDLKYVRSDSKGIKISVPDGTDAIAINDGVVTKLFSLPGVKNSVIIRHGSYLTVYSNIVSVFVKQGDKVKTGQHIGKIYVDKKHDSNAVLQFQLWKGTTRLNPELWIKK